MIKKLLYDTTFWNGNSFSRIHEDDIVIVLKNDKLDYSILILTKIGIGYVLPHVLTLIEV